MKKRIIFSIALLSATAAFAQKDADAKAILSRVSAKYKTLETVKTDFSFTLDNPQAGVKETQTGTLIARPKQNKFKVSLYGTDAKNGTQQEIISDGKTQWTYLKKDKEVQVSAADNGSEAINPAKIFTLYEKGYKYVFTGTENVSGRTCQVIDLSPEDANADFFKVRLLIDKAKKQIYSATVFSKGGGRYTYRVDSMTPNVPIKDNVFSFDKKDYPGVEVVDLR